MAGLGLHSTTFFPCGFKASVGRACKFCSHQHGAEGKKQLNYNLVSKVQHSELGSGTAITAVENSGCSLLLPMAVVASLDGAAIPG